MSKWQKLKNRIRLALHIDGSCQLENDLARIGVGNPSVIFDVGAHLGQLHCIFENPFQLHTFTLLNLCMKTSVNSN